MLSTRVRLLYVSLQFWRKKNKKKNPQKSNVIISKAILKE